MKNPIKKLFVILAIVMSFVAVQSVWAGDLTIEDGTIERIGTGLTGSIDVSKESTLYTFYDIPFTALYEEAGIILEVNDEVTVTAYVVNFPNGNIKNIAFSINKGDVVYTWHPNVPKAGSNAP